MNTKQEINIVYKYYIPEDWLTELGKEFSKHNILLIKEKDQEDYHNFTGPELSDIIIYIKDNFLSQSLYDVIKASVIILWKKLRKASPKKHNSQNVKAGKISIRAQDSKNRKIEINIEGDIKDELIKSVVDRSFQYLESDMKEEVFKQPDFVDNSNDEEKIELKYNPESDTWEPENFGELRREMDNLWKLSDEDYRKSN